MARRFVLISTHSTSGSILSRTITIDHTKCGTANSSTFPVLVSLSDSTLKTLSNGGHVANINGYDIQFFSDIGETVLLNWEVEFYDPVNGILIAWVSVPTVSYTSDIVFYMQYGDSSITSFQGGSLGSAWNSNYKAVWHFGTSSSLGLTDSTSNGNNVTNGTGVAAGTGKIGGAALFSGSDWLSMSTAPYASGTGSFSCAAWFKSTVTGVISAIIAYGDLTVTNNGWLMYATTLNKFEMDTTNSGGPVSLATIADGTWHHVVMVFNSGLGNVQLYVDGIASGISVSMTPNITSAAGSIGSDQPTYSDNCYGYVDELSVVSVPLSTSWITTMYNNQNSPGNIGSPSFLTIGNEY